MQMKVVGHTDSETPLMGYRSPNDDDYILYHLHDKLVAVGYSPFYGNSNYWCLPGIWEPSVNTQVVNKLPDFEFLK